MRTSLCLATLILLSSCSTQPYVSKPLQSASIATAYDARSLADPALRRFFENQRGQSLRHWPIERWDPDTLALAAFHYSPDLAAARAKWGTARARVVTAAQRPNPLLQLPFQLNADPAGGASPWTFGFGLDIPIETAGKRGARTEEAQRLSDTARFAIGNAAWKVRSRLRTHLLVLYDATRRADTLHQQIGAQRDVVTMLEKRLSLGAADASTLNQQRILLIQASAALTNAEKLCRDARAQAATVIGVPVRELEILRINFDEFERIHPEIPAAQAQRTAILNRADLLGALSQYEASQAALRLQIANQYPDIHLGPGYSWDAGANKIAFGASGIALPLLNRNEGLIAEAETGRAEAEANVKSLQALAINDTARAIVSYRASLHSLRQAEQLLAAQRRQFADAQVSFNVGATDRLALELARQTIFASLLARQDALTQTQQALGLLEDAMQRPLFASPIPTTSPKEKQHVE